MKEKRGYNFSGLDRRNFIKTAGLATTGLAMAPKMVYPNSSADVKKVRVGFIGLGGRGVSILRNALKVEGVEVIAVCDILEERNTLSQKIIIEAGQPKPEAYGRGPEDWRRLMERTDLDTVICAGPLEIHPPTMIACMEKGIIGGTELPACDGIDEAWELIEVYHRTGVPFMMLENYIYQRFVQMVQNMISQDVFGVISHCTSGYQHESPYVMFDENGKLLWRGKERALRNGNQYPTHAVGPAAKWLNINRGDRFEYLVSMGGRSVGLNHYAKKTLGSNHPFAHKDWPLNDVNVSLIKTYKGINVAIYYDAILPRPWDLIHRVQGTKGMAMGTVDGIYLEGRSPSKQYEPASKYYDEYDHPNWKKHGEIARTSGHGGGDYLMVLDFIDAVRNKRDVTVDPYDAVTWTILNDLSETSVNNKSRPVDFPDFTLGKWKTRKPLPIRAI